MDGLDAISVIRKVHLDCTISLILNIVYLNTGMLSNKISLEVSWGYVY